MQAGFFPASKRALQVQNLQRALAALKTGEGYLAGLPARLVDELADGFREATLDFLWNLLLQHQVAQHSHASRLRLLCMLGPLTEPHAVSSGMLPG